MLPSLSFLSYLHRTAESMLPLKDVPQPLQSKLNCEVLHDDLAFEVRWAVAGDSVVLQLVAKLDDGEYMAFGLSGEPTKSVMVGGDVVVAWVDKATLKGSAVDYYLDAKSQCSGGRGSCPDNRIKDNANSVRLLNAALVNGYSIVTYQRPIVARDTLDKAVHTNGTQPIIWAVGPLNQRGEVSYHSLFNKEDILLDFGRAPKWNCPLPDGGQGSDDQDKEQARPPAQTAVTTRPPATPAPHPTAGAWEIPPIQCHEPEDGVFYAQMGPTGGKHGYPAITGHVGWGISWYINGLLIPEINVVRGKTYTFVVEGGLDPETPARYHPFYITDDPVGGFEHKNAQERANVRIFAGAEQDKRGKIVPTGTGRLCNWTPDPNQPLADEFASFGAYQRTLTLVCDEGEPGVVQWTPDANTPDTVYYQCFTHRYLGWKINVLDSCDSAARSGAASEPVPSKVEAPKSVTKELEEPVDGDLDGKPSIQVETRVKPFGQNLFDTPGISSEDKSLFLSGIEKLSAHAKDSFQLEKQPQPEQVAAPIGLEGLGLDPTTLSILQEAKQKELELAQAHAAQLAQHHFQQGHGLPPHGAHGAHVKYRPMLYKMPYSHAHAPSSRPAMRPARPMYLPQSSRPLPPGMLLHKPQSLMTSLQALPAHNYVIKKKPLYRLPAMSLYGMHGMGMLSTLRPVPVPVPVPVAVPVGSPSQAALAAALYASLGTSSTTTTTTTPAPLSLYRPLGPLSHLGPLSPLSPLGPLAPHHRPAYLSSYKPSSTSTAVASAASTHVTSHFEPPQRLPTAAVNTGFNPGSVVVEGGFKPILQRRQDVAEDRMAFVEGEEDDDELMEGSVVEMEKRSSEAIDEDSDSQDSLPKQTETFEPMFIPSPPDRNSLKPGLKKVVEHGKLIVRPRPAIVRRPLYPNMVLPPFKIPARVHRNKEDHDEEEEEEEEKETAEVLPAESEHDETMMAAERMDTYYLPPQPHIAIVTYDGKAVDADVAATIPRPPGDAIRSPNSADLVRGTPQFGPFLGEAPPPVPAVASPQDLPQLHAPRQVIQALPLESLQSEASELLPSNSTAPAEAASAEEGLPAPHRERRSPHHEPGHEGHDEEGSAPSRTTSLGPVGPAGFVFSTLCAMAVSHILV